MLNYLDRFLQVNYYKKKKKNKIKNFKNQKLKSKKINLLEFLKFIEFLYNLICIYYFFLCKMTCYIGKRLPQCILIKEPLQLILLMVNQKVGFIFEKSVIFTLLLQENSCLFALNNRKMRFLKEKMQYKSWIFKRKCSIKSNF